MTKLTPEHLSGIAFDWVVVRELRFVDNPAGAGFGTLQNLSVTVTLNSKVSNDGRSCRTTLRVKLDPPEDNPEAFQAVMATVEGSFSVHGEATVDLPTFSRQQAPAILMPFVREAIATATAKSRFGQMLLPPINVAALTEEMEKQGAKPGFE